LRREEGTVAGTAPSVEAAGTATDKGIKAAAQFVDGTIETYVPSAEHLKKVEI
jgi:hypothetical protein